MNERLPVVIGVDPGKAGSLAAVSLDPHPRLMALQPWGSDDATAVNLIRVLMGFNLRPACLAVEAQFVGVNPSTALRLAQRAGRWEEACRLLGISFAFINPTMWQRAELGISRRARRPQVKALSMSKVRGTFGALPANIPDKYLEHAADAALIARFASIRYQRDGLQPMLTRVAKPVLEVQW